MPPSWPSSTGQPVFVTLAERGIVGALPGRRPEHVPAHPVRGPIDIVGAGDAVTANLAAALAAGADAARGHGAGHGRRFARDPPTRYDRHGVGLADRRTAHAPPDQWISDDLCRHENPATGWGTYGSSSRATSSGASLIDKAATASSR